jgi:hypothetical protein
VVVERDPGRWWIRIAPPRNDSRGRWRRSRAGPQFHFRRATVSLNTIGNQPSYASH